MNKPSAKSELLSTLRTLLRDALRLQAEGAGCLRLGRAQGSADGFMRALLETGVAPSAELLAIVAEERAARSGPATCVVSDEGASVAA
jgi:hypothetical protein